MKGAHNPLYDGKGAKNIHNSNMKSGSKGKPSSPLHGKGGK